VTIEIYDVAAIDALLLRIRTSEHSGRTR